MGRNRGFRGGQHRDHIAVFPPRLYRWVEKALQEQANYVGYLRSKPSVVVDVPKPSKPAQTKKAREIVSELDYDELAGFADDFDLVS